MAEQPLPIKTRPVTGSEWMIAIRDYQFDITPAEFALGSLYGTSGNWGQDVWLTDVAIAKILGVKRQTVSGWRKSLLAKGLIEVTGKHPTQPNAWRLRLTLPAELPKPRKDESRGDVRSTDSQLVVGSPFRGHPMSAEGTPDVRSTDRGMSAEGTQHLDLELEQDLAVTSTSPAGPDDDDTATTHQDPSQSQRQDDWLDRFLADTAPEVPEDGPGGDASPADGGAGLRLWTGDDMGDNRAAMAEDLKVPVNTIGESFWTWLEDLDLDPGSWWDQEAVKDAAEASLGKPSPVGYFRGALPSILARYRAERDDRAA